MPHDQRHPFSYPVAARYAGMASSPLKDIFALAARENVISFAGGIPDPQLFDLGAVTETYDWVLTHHGVRALQYGVSEGETELRRSEEHTSELQSRGHLVCRLQLVKKKVAY